MRKARRNLTLEMLASKVLVAVTTDKAPAPIRDLAGQFGVDETDVEDALYYLVMSGFLEKSYKHCGWSSSSHRRNRPTADTPLVQTAMFPRERVPRRKKGEEREGYQRADTDEPSEQTVTRRRRVEIEVGILDPASAVASVRRSLETDGWKIAEWKPKPRAKGRVLVTLAKESVVWRAEQ